MPLKFNITLDQQALAELTGPGGEIDQAIAKAAGKVRDRAKDNIDAAGRVDIGDLRQSIITEPGPATDGTITYQIGSNLTYKPNWAAGTLHEEGTGIYGPRGTRIVPRRARVLRFKPGKNSTIPAGKDGFVYARSVKGMPGIHFLRDAIESFNDSDLQ